MKSKLGLGLGGITVAVIGLCLAWQTASWAAEERGSQLSPLAAGDNLFMAGKAREAAGFYEMALASDPGKSTILTRLGAAYNRTGELEKARMAYEEALASDPNEAMTHFQLGNVLAAMNLLDEAIAEYRQCIALNPDMSEVYEAMGKALRTKHQISMARHLEVQA